MRQACCRLLKEFEEVDDISLEEVQLVDCDCYNKILKINPQSQKFYELTYLLKKIIINLGNTIMISNAILLCTSFTIKKKNISLNKNKFSIYLRSR